MKLRNLEENSGSWRRCDFYLLIVLPANADNHRTAESTGTTPWFPSAMKIFPPLLGSLFPTGRIETRVLKSVVAPQSRSNIRARFDPSGD